MTAREYDRTCTCPNRRAPGKMIALWSFVAERPDPSQGQTNLLPTPMMGNEYINTMSGQVPVQSLTTPRSMATASTMPLLPGPIQ